MAVLILILLLHHYTALPTNTTATNPTILIASTRSTSNYNSDRSSTTVHDLNSTRITTRDTQTIHHYDSDNSAIIKLELETEIEDNSVELEKTEKDRIGEACKILVKLAGCKYCLVEVLKLQKTHLPINVIRPSQRIKRQTPTTSSLENVIKSFFQALPHDIQLSPSGRARIVGKREPEPEDTSNNEETFMILMITFAIIAVVLLIMLAFAVMYWVKFRRETQTTKQSQQQLQPMEQNLVPADSTPMSEIPEDKPDEPAKLTTVTGVSLEKAVAMQQNAQPPEEVAKPRQDAKDKRDNTINKDKRMLTKEEEPTYITGTSAITGTNKSGVYETAKVNPKIASTYPVAVAAIEKLEKATEVKDLDKEQKKASVAIDNEYDEIDKQPYFIKDVVVAI